MAIALLVAFTTASLLRPDKEASDCGCFGSFGTLNVKNVIARNVALTALAIVPLAAGASSYSTDSAWGALPGLALAAALSALLLVAARTPAAVPVVGARESLDITDPGRRSFLGKVAMLSVGAAAVAVHGAAGSERSR